MKNNECVYLFGLRNVLFKVSEMTLEQRSIEHYFADFEHFAHWLVIA